MNEPALVAVVTAVPATLAAIAAMLSTRRTRRDVQTGNGQTLGEMMSSVSADLNAHTAQDQANFAALYLEQAEQRSELAGIRSELARLTRAE